MSNSRKRIVLWRISRGGEGRYSPGDRQRVRSRVWFDVARDDVSAAGQKRVGLLEHGVSFAYACRVAEKNLELAGPLLFVRPRFSREERPDRAVRPLSVMLASRKYYHGNASSVRFTLRTLTAGSPKTPRNLPFVFFAIAERTAVSSMPRARGDSRDLILRRFRRDERIASASRSRHEVNRDRRPRLSLSRLPVSDALRHEFALLRSRRRKIRRT